MFSQSLLLLSIQENENSVSKLTELGMQSTEVGAHYTGGHAERGYRQLSYKNASISKSY